MSLKELLVDTDLCNLNPLEDLLIADVKTSIEKKGGQGLDEEEGWWLEVEEALAYVESGCLREIKSAIIEEDGGVNITLYSF